MKFFTRNTNSPAPDPAMTELGREYAIAKRHGDRKTASRINRQLGNASLSASDRDAFNQGKDAYDAIPPIKPARRNRRR
ncbi:hypothetical protein [Streptomyces clavifer]|uniref:hypothetical protein n=1 Tax=Streptomyces clavifer TaxID=68188 RepID=UPI003084D1C7|nr:hypothetical protein OG388_11935 [Streptomyces clavifer]